MFVHTGGVAFGADVDPLDDLRAKIDTYGWAVRNVSDADPAKCLSFTVGLTAHAHPEVVMTGLPPEVGTAFLNIVGEIVVREGGRFAAGEKQRRSWQTVRRCRC